MTDRLYYENSYLFDFDAVIQAEKQEQDSVWLAFDRSAFYPTSGGQPYDTGFIEIRDKSLEVLDVQVDQDGVVWHQTNQTIPVGTAVHGKINVQRRLDHMEQHGGEHMLAGAIWEILGGTTIGLHLGAEESSIDVSMPDGRTHLTEEELEMVENLVNDRIRKDAPIRCWFPSDDELKRLPLRKQPAVSNHIRIVAIGDYEMVPCGGTHPSSTGKIGQIKIIGAIPCKGKIRVSFVCGKRAEKLFRKYMICANKAGNIMSCPIEKLAIRAGELKARLAEAERKVRRYETESVLKVILSQGERESLKDIEISLTVMEEGDAKSIAEAVSRYISEDGRILLLCAGEKLTFARSRDVDIDMNELIRRVARGGGRPDMANGTGIPQCAEVAKKILITEGKGRKWRKKI